MAHPDREHVYRVRDEPNGSQPATATMAAAAASSYFRRNSFATIHPPPDHPADDGHHHTHHHHLLGLHEYRARRRSSAFSMDDADTLQGTSNATQAYDTANTSPQGPRLGADEEIGAHAGTTTHDRAFGDVVAVVDDERVSPPLPPLDFDELAARRRSSVFVGGTSAGPPALTLRTSTFRRQSRVHSIAHADGDDPNLVDLHSVLSTPCHAGAARRVSAPSSTSYAAWGALLAGCANPSFGHSVSNQHANTYNHQQQPSQQPQPGSGASVGSGNVPRGLASVDSAAALAAASLLRSPVMPVGPSFTPSSESLLGAGASGSVRAGMFSPGSPARAAARRASDLSAFELQPDTESTTDDGPAAAGMSAASGDFDFTPAALKTIRETTEDKRASAACELAFAKRLLEYLVSPAATAWYMAGIDPLAHVVRLYHVHRDRDARETRIAMELLPGTTVRDVPEVAAHRRRVHVAAAADPASPLVRTSSVVAVQLTTQPVCVGSAIAAARARSQKNPAAAEDGAHDADGSPPRALLQPTTDLHEGGGGSGHSSLTSNRPSLLSGSLHTVTATATTTTTTTTAATDGARTGTNATIETATTTTVSLTHTGGADSPLIAPLPNPPHPSANSADDEEERFVVFHRRPSAPAMSQETPRALARLRLARDVALSVCCSASLDAALRDVARDALEGLRFLHDELRVV
eukprot:CAMPEP_0174879866 /NCGR_PEP_ID=MMETSP1114-20130205/83476_1 /TAXON_ID=312471 /ORGANISM="Neobodo designis, Strain CCAP 1951/1" /LENGTH=693 /DNA_ID=CAMNT_0016115261 /DNA_START=430 /DNA_END=2507 /DNA_ORIENTATION=+